jgi:hypothetical protein
MHYWSNVPAVAFVNQWSKERIYYTAGYGASCVITGRTGGKYFSGVRNLRSRVGGNSGRVGICKGVLEGAKMRTQLEITKNKGSS